MRTPKPFLRKNESFEGPNDVKLHNLATVIEGGIFQTFWKHDCCTIFVFFELGGIQQLRGQEEGEGGHPKVRKVVNINMS